MPIRFRCVYCNQLLGIARRKAGTVVQCTNCNGQIVVPKPAAAARKPTSAPRANLFEDGDFDELLRPLLETELPLDGGTQPTASPQAVEPPRRRPPTAVEGVPHQRLPVGVFAAAAGLILGFFLIGVLFGRVWG